MSINNWNSQLKIIQNNITRYTGMNHTQINLHTHWYYNNISVTFRL